MDNKNTPPAPEPVRSPRAVQTLAPTMLPSLDALVRYGRGLMDASLGAEALFERHFSGRAEVDELGASMDEELKVTSSVWIKVPMNTSVDPNITVALTSGTETAQKWAVKFCGSTIAEKTLSDRSALAKLPEDQARQPVDGEWIFSRMCIENFIKTGAPADSVGLKIIKSIISTAAQTAEKLHEETKQPGYVQQASADRDARWAGAFSKQAEAPAQMDQGLDKGVDISALMGRLSKASRIAKP